MGKEAANRFVERASLAWKAVLILFLLTSSGCGLTEARIKKEKEASAHYKLGISYLNENQLQKAFIEFHKAAEIDPDNKDVQYGLGHIHFQKQDYVEAVNAFKKAISIDARFSEAHNYLGKVYEVQGTLDKAIVEYQEALKNPQYDTPQKPYLNLGLVYMKQEKYDQATREFQRVLQIDPNNVVAHNELGRSYYQMGKPKEAISSYQEAIRMAPNYLDAHYNLAFAYMKEGSKGLAATQFKKVIEISPQSQLAKDSKKFLDALQ